MNQIKATIKDISNVDSLNFIELSTDTQEIYALSLELPDSFVVGKCVTLGIKSTDIGLSKERLSHTSYTNQLKAEIVQINEGLLLTSILVDIDGYVLESLISTKAFNSMGLIISDKLFAIVSESHITLG